MLDFNNIKDSPKVTPPIDVRNALIAKIESVLIYLFPNGKIHDGQFEIGDVTGNPGGSLKIGLDNGKSGLWYDFATGEGGDILDLWASCHGLDVKGQFLTVIRSASDWLGTGGCDIKRNSPKSKAKAYDDLGPHTGKWDYLDVNGNLIACVYRYDTPKGKKYRPWDVVNRRHCAPDPRPLYNLPGIKDAQHVVLVEGEKAADALILKGINATTAMFGANAPIDKTDWSPLDGKNVLIWPDNDEAGHQYAGAVSRYLGGMIGKLSLSILAIPDDKPKGWDAADAVADDWGFVIASCIF